MRNKIIFTILILVVFFSFVQTTNAVPIASMYVPAAPSPICEITAKVLEVEKIEYYRVKLQILEISTYRQEGARFCNSSYIETAEKSGQILTLAEYDKTPIREGQKIKAKIHFGGDERFGGFFLSDIQILEDKTTAELGYWYYIIPSIIILFMVVLYMFFKRKKR